MSYTPPATPQNPETVSQQMIADPRVQAAYSKYRDTRNQQDFSTYLDTIRPYLSQIDQNHYGIDPETGLFRGTSNYGHWWKMATGMAAGAALPYGPYAGAAAGAGQKATDYIGQDVNAVAQSGANPGGGGANWWNLAKLGGSLAVPAVSRAIAGGGGNPSAGTGSTALPPELGQLLQMQLKRIQAAQPNYDLMLRYARGLTPTWARNDSGATGQPDPQMASIIQRLAQPRG